MASQTTINKQGQVMGSKGRGTEQRLLRTTAELIGRKPLRDIRVADIARAAKTSTSTFYVYFQDVEDAVLELTKQTSDATLPAVDIVNADWPKDKTVALAHEFVTDFFEYWDANEAILRVRNMAAEEGDERFARERITAAAPFIKALQAKLEKAQVEGKLSANIDPNAATIIIITALERLGAARYPESVGGDTSYSRRGTRRPDRDRLIGTMARLIALMITGSAD